MDKTSDQKISWFWSGEEPEWLVILTVLGALLIGGVLMTISISRTRPLALGQVSLSYPANWSASEGIPELSVGAQDLASSASVTISYQRKLDPQAPVTMNDLVAERSFELAQNTQLFRVLETKTTQVNGKKAVMLSYAFVSDPATSSYQSTLPRVIQGEDYLIPYQGIVYCVAFQDEASAWQASRIERVLKSIRFAQ